MSDVCTTCKTKRPKYAHWFYIYADIPDPAGRVPVAIYCRQCVPIGAYVMSKRGGHLVLTTKK